MTYFKSARTLGIASFVVFSTALTPPAKRVAGITFDAVTTTSLQSAMAGGSTDIVVTMKGMATGDGSMRMDVSDVQTPAGAPPVYVVGDYMLQSEGHFVLVHPSTKTYVDMVDQTMSALKGLPPQVLAAMTINDVKGETSTVDGAEVIEGRQSTHYRTTMSYTMAVMGQTLPSTVVTDYWVVKLPVKFTTPFASTVVPAMSDGPMGELMKKRLELTPAMGDGVPVRMTMSTTMQMMGQSMAHSTSSDIKNIKEGDVDASKFVLPAGYTKAAK